MLQWQNVICDKITGWRKIGDENSGSHEYERIWNRSVTTFLRSFRCCPVRFFGTVFAQIFLMLRPSVRMRWTVSRFMFNSFDIILAVNRLSVRTNLRTLAMSSLRTIVGVHLQRLLLPLANILCHRKSCAIDITSFQKACWSFPSVMAFSPSFTQNKMSQRCALSCGFICIVEEQTYNSTNQAAVPHLGLQDGASGIRMEGGPRSNISGRRLLSCLIRWEKISLIILLSNLVWSSFSL